MEKIEQSNQAQNKYHDHTKHVQTSEEVAISDTGSKIMRINDKSSPVMDVKMGLSH